jgi:hypothetical protein
MSMTLLQIEADRFRENFGAAPFLVRHALADHPLFALPRLVELARTLPARQVEYNAGKVPLTLDPAETPRNGLSAEETVRRIEECSSWLVLKNVETHAEYGELLERCLAEVRLASPRLTRGMRDCEAFIFVSSPGALTPYHMDPEENFLLQIRGRKTMHVFDRSVLSEREIESFFNGGHRNLAYRDEYAHRSSAFALAPGKGVHVPVIAPHWVQNGPEVSISFSVTFRTAASTRTAQVHRFNAALRRWGLRPAPAGESRLRDTVKQLLFRTGARAARLVGA